MSRLPRNYPGTSLGLNESEAEGGRGMVEAGELFTFQLLTFVSSGDTRVGEPNQPRSGGRP